MTKQTHPQRVTLGRMIRRGCGPLLAALLCAGPAIASTQLDDPFTDGGRTDGADAQDTSWYKVAGTDSSLNVVSGELDFNNPSTGQYTIRALLGNFDVQTLGARDKLVLSLDLALTGSAPYYDYGGASSPTGTGKIRIGLLNGSASPIAADTGSAPSDHAGYFSSLSVDTETSAQLTEDRANIAETSFMGGNDLNGLYNNTSFGGLNDNNAHRLVFSVQNTGDGDALLDHRLDNRYAGFAVDTSGPQYTFSEVGITSQSSVDLKFDNIKVQRWTNRVYDTFDVGSATRGDDVNDPTDVQYWREGPTLSAATDAPLGQGNASNKALSVDNTSNFGKFLANYERFTLDDVGEMASFSFDYARDTATSTALTSSSGLRFGLYDSGVNQVTADNTIGSKTTDDDGYMFQLGVGESGSSLRREIGSEGTDGILGGANSGNDVAGGTNNGWAGFDDTSVYFIELLLTRVSTGLNIQLFIDGNLIIDKTDTDARAVYSFDEFGFGIGSTNYVYDYRLDNINLDVMTFVPTPAALPAGLALLGLIAVRRR